MYEVPIFIVKEGAYFLHEGMGYVLTHNDTVDKWGERVSYARGSEGYCSSFERDTTVIVDHPLDLDHRALWWWKDSAYPAQHGKAQVLKS